ncbi:histidine phosphatase family protein [Isoptericola sp. NPDC057653]|uniref:histidine phosphatase family protein n=1 Tax=Isoptericola sp. NPDC057653 TaxID=3346195 RepID=UPI0036B410D1
MPTRHLHVLRHGAADPFGELSGEGERQAELAGRRLAALPVDAVWHSPLPRAARSAQVLAAQLPDVPVAAAPELTDHVPHLPDPVPPGWEDFFDDEDRAEAADGARLAAALTARFARPAATETHEVLVTHAFQVAWLVRDALAAPPESWLGMPYGNASLTTLEYRDDRGASLILSNDMGHLPPELRWTGFGPVVRP